MGKMSIKEQIAAARSRIKESKSGAGGEGFWLPKDKPVQVRVLPQVTDGKANFDELFMVEATMWSIPGFKDSVIDPEILTGEESPMRTRWKEIKALNDPSNKKLLGWFKPKTRWFMRLVKRKMDTDGTTVINDPSLPALYYFAPMDIADEYLKLYDDPEYGILVVDPSEGLDFTFLKAGEGVNTEYSASPRRKPTPLFDDEESIKSLLASMPTLEDKLESLILPVEKLEEMTEKMDASKASTQARKVSGKLKSTKFSEESEEPDEEDADIEEKEEKAEKPSSSSLRERMKKRV